MPAPRLRAHGAHPLSTGTEIDVSTLAGIGRSTRRDPRDAGLEAVRAACAPLGDRAPHLLLVFAASGYDPAGLFEGIRSAAPGCRVSGCSGEGIITPGHSDEGERVVGVMAVWSDSLRFDPLLARNYSADAAAAGAELARQARAVGREDAFALLLFPDGLKGNCASLLGALLPALPPNIRVAGGASGDALTFVQTWQYLDGEAATDAVSALLVSGAGELDIEVSHGCMPIGLERHVTSAADGWVREIDGEPAWTVFRQYLDGAPEDLNTEGSIHLSVGEHVPTGPGGGDKSFVIRTPMALDKATGALFFPGGGIAEGGAMRLTRRDPMRVCTSARECAELIAARHADRSPVLVLQFDCAGRGKQLFGSRTAESIVTPLQEVLGPRTPWLGFHTYGEIAPIGDRTYYHNFTVALCALYEKPATA